MSMKVRSWVVRLSSVLLVGACGGETNTPSETGSEESTGPVPSANGSRAEGTVAPAAALHERVSLSKAEKGRVCRAAIAAVMGRDPSIIQVTSTSGDIVQTRYTRDDGTVWKNQCRVEDGRVIWAAVDVNGPGTGPGRWRDEDELLFTISGPNIRIQQSMMGEPVSDDTFAVQ